METLLEKVQHLEAELQQRMTEAEAAERARLNNLTTNEAAALADVRARAEQRGAAIMAERRGAAEAEIAAMRGDRQRSVEALTISAAKNRPQAVARALQLFREAYGL